MHTVTAADAAHVLAVTPRQFVTLADIWRAPTPVKRAGRGGPARYLVEELTAWLYRIMPSDRFHAYHELRLREQAAPLQQQEEEQ